MMNFLKHRESQLEQHSHRGLQGHGQDLLVIRLCSVLKLFKNRIWILVFACSKSVVQAKHLAIINAPKYVTFTPARLMYCIQSASCLA
jgi:hypothetical protein